MGDDSEKEKPKGTKKCVTKRLLKLIDYKNCLLNNKVILNSQQRFKSEKKTMHTLNKSIWSIRLH